MGKLLKKLQKNSGRLLRFALPCRKHWMQSVIFYLALVMVGVLVFNALVVDATTGSDILGWIAYGLAQLSLLAARLFMALAVFLLRFFVQLAGYNGFLDAPVVKVGWVMIRDLANMFFVVALLVIAFSTILGGGNYAWQRTMVKLVLMAIFINFSMLICGLVIDAAHVFTMTFLNAVAPTAGGNLINLFNLDTIQSMVVPSGESAATIEGGGDMTLEIFAGAALSAVLAGITMITIGAYTMIMLVRMVALWVLIILSPLAFIFAVLPKTESYAKEWMGQFTRYVIVAPVMVFFLWLSFATLTGVAEHVGVYSSVEESRFAANDQEAADVGQTVSVNLGTTWHNLAGFLVATAFMFIGIAQVQQTGVKGAGWAESGIGFGKKVAAIATGYAAGKWLAGEAKQRGVSGVKEWAGDYAKLFAGKVGLPKIPIVGSQSARRLRRKAALKKMEDYYGRRGEEIEALQESKFFGVRRGTRAKQAVKAQAARALEAAEIKKEESKYSGRIFMKQLGTYKKQVDRDQYIKMIKDKYDGGPVTGEKDIVAIENRKNQILEEMQVRGALRGTEARILQSKIAEEQANILDRSVQSQMGWETGQLNIGVVKDQALIEQSRFEDLKGKMTHDVKLGLVAEGMKLEKQRLETGDFDDMAYEKFGEKFEKLARDKGVGDYIDDEDFVEQNYGGDKKAAIKDLARQFGGADYDQIQTDYDNYKNQLQTRLNELNATDLGVVDTQVASLVADMKAGEKKGAKKSEKKKAVQAREKLEELYKENQGGIDEAFLANQELRRVTLGKARKQSVKGLPLMEMLYREGKKAQKEGKYNAMQEYLGSVVQSYSRYEENKDAKPYLKFVENEISDNLADFNRKDFDQLFREMQMYHKQLRELGEKEKNKTISNEEKTTLKNARQQQMLAVSSALERGFGGSLMSSFYGLDKDYKQIKANDPAEMHKAVLGILTGAKVEDLQSDEKLLEQQERLRIGQKEKHDFIFRTMARAAQTASDKHGHGQLMGLVQEGVDQSGERLVGFSSLMKAGVGKGERGTVKFRLGTGNVNTNGKKYRADKWADFYDANKTFDTSNDGRAMVVLGVAEVGGQEVTVAEDFIDESYLKAMVEGISKKSANQIAGLDTPKMQFVGGGGYGQSSIDLFRKAGKGNNGFYTTSGMAKGIRELHREYAKLYKSASNTATRDKLKESMRNVYAQWGGDFDKFLEENGQALKTLLEDPHGISYGGVDRSADFERAMEDFLQSSIDDSLQIKRS